MSASTWGSIFCMEPDSATMTRSGSPENASCKTAALPVRHEMVCRLSSVLKCTLRLSACCESELTIVIFMYLLEAE